MKRYGTLQSKRVGRKLFWPICLLLLVFLSFVLYFGDESVIFVPKEWQPSLLFHLRKTTGFGTARLRSRFKGLKIRSFPQHEIKFSEKSILSKGENLTPRTNHKWAHQRSECKKWSVSTTVLGLSDDVRTQMDLPPDWCLVIVGDQKGPQNYPINEGRKGRLIYLSVQDQQQMAAEGVILGKNLPWSDPFGRKNLGYLFAIASGAQLIWDFDFDTSVSSTPPKIMEPYLDDKSSETLVLKPKAKNNTKICDFFNPLSRLGAEQLGSWPRGLPLGNILDSDCQTDAYQFEKTTVDRNSIAVYQFLASNNPDVDDLYNLNHPLPFNFNTGQHKLPLLVTGDFFGPSARKPVCSRMTLF